MIFHSASVSTPVLFESFLEVQTKLGATSLNNSIQVIEFSGESLHLRKSFKSMIINFFLYPGSRNV